MSYNKNNMNGYQHIQSFLDGAIVKKRDQYHYVVQGIISDGYNTIGELMQGESYGSPLTIEQYQGDPTGKLAKGQKVGKTVEDKHPGVPETDDSKVRVVPANGDTTNGQFNSD